MKLIAIYSKWSKSVCWIVYGESGKSALKWLEKNKVPYARNMDRWSFISPTVEQVKEFMTKDKRVIPEIDIKGNVIGKKQISIKKSDPLST